MKIVSQRSVMMLSRMTTLDLGNQDLKDLLQNMLQMKIAGSRYELSTRRIEDELKTRYAKEKDDAVDSRLLGGVACASGAAASLALTCWWNPVGWVAALAWTGVAAVGCPGVYITVEAQLRINKVNAKLGNVKEGELMATAAPPRELR